MIPHTLTAGRDFRRYSLIYTVGFAILSVFVFIWFLAMKYSFVLAADGWNQHVNALAFYGQYLRSIVRNLVEHHRLIIPNWDFSIGEGSDVVATLHYYVIGEPINLLSVFVPTRYIISLYTGLILLRLFLAGLSFTALCVGTGKRNTIPVLFGSYAYLFCGWSLYNAARHPYFITPMIYLPLLILGAERIFHRKSPTLFSVAVMLAAVSNFYYFYMLVLLVAMYCVIRVLSLYALNIKEILAAFFRMLIPAVIGVMMAGIILLPMLFTFLGDNRNSIDFSFSYLYPLSYYSNLPGALLGYQGKYWVKTGLAAPALLALYLVFIQKKNGFYKALSATCLLFILSPVFGQLLNGMSYQSNRWTFSLGLLSAYLMVAKWDSLLHLTRYEFRGLSFCLAVHFFLCCLLDRSRTMESFFALCAMGLCLMILAPIGEKRLWAERLLSMMVVVSILGHSFWFYSPEGDYYLENNKTMDTARSELFSSDAAAVKKVAKKDKKVLPRFSNGDFASPLRNSSTLNDISCSECYWSILNPVLTSFTSELCLSYFGGIPQLYTSVDNRASLLALSSTDYIATSEAFLTIPYDVRLRETVDLHEGYMQELNEKLKTKLGVDTLTEKQLSLIEKQNSNIYHIYENPNALPVGYCYDSYITGEVWRSLNPVERQEAMLRSVYLDGESSLPMVVPANNVTRLPYEVECSGKHITYQDGTVITTAANQKLVLHFDGMENAETYLYLSGLDARYCNRYELYLGGEDIDPLDRYSRLDWELLDAATRLKLRTNNLFRFPESDFMFDVVASDGQSDTITLRTKDDSYYSGITDFSLFLGYSRKPIDSITITFPVAGVYTFDEMLVQSVSMEPFADVLAQRRESALTDVSVGTDTLTGRISLKEPRLLCITVPYSEGWTAYVDGVETPILPANIKYMGLELPAGDHDIRLEYTSPHRTQGAILTLLGIVAFAAMRSVRKPRGKRALR